jgi:hypothetical protein
MESSPERGASRSDQRSVSRVHHAVRVRFSSNGIEGSGKLRDLSTRGARIEDASIRPVPETAVILTVDLREEVLAVRLVGNVVRLTETGFALQFFLDPDPSLEALLRWVSAEVEGLRTTED